ncbi:hypothetical protein [Streptosporangium roseum]|uniref:Uncharacterized protein n=1 Tax=Streptosporangium roseum (strain ATCC 12428 / DSM 43021 / JCM 3005 / KCTC 9067 / NCIMB 10171 / NRRL 2505 / NI 9100) TaxID=479432 RepID=D2ASC1_STRRD|nr:hypothetical protein [Streptosporangium roseum]ACZ86648.1 hypothetical protein Sros_3725 [Streptosporangium roseum DSM 43021]
MPSDPDHVLDAIDGAVDEWLAMSEDSMRWAPPEKAPPKRQLALPAPPLPRVSEEFLHDVGVLFGAQTQAVAEAVTEVFRPLGESLAEALAAFLDSPAVRQFVELVEPPGERALPGPAERDGLPPEPPPSPPPEPRSDGHP